MEDLQADIYQLSHERYLKKNGELNIDEFSLVYKSLNNLSGYIKDEFHDLRTDVSQWEAFFSTMPRGLLAIDHERTIINCNKNALNILNVETLVQETVGKSVMAIFRNADINRITSDFFNSDKCLKEYEFEIYIDNIVETIKVICVELDLEDEEEIGAMVIMENITALRRLETMRRDFVANVSHELKTPIAIIGGFVETLKECLDDPGSAMRFIEIIEKNTARLTLIIDDLLSLSKLEQNEALIKRNFESRDILETIKAALDVCSHEALDKDIQILLDLEDSKYYKDPSMFANHRLLEQAFRNLIENAIRYSPRESNISIKSRKTGELIEISVKDSGPGIAPEHHEKIFERFYRVDKSRDRQTGGSGLGLAIVKHIVRIHNGHVKLDSALGAGARFTITLPYLKSTATRSFKKTAIPTKASLGQPPTPAQALPTDQESHT